MSDDSSGISSVDEILAQLLKEIEGGADRDEAIRRYSRARPELAGEIADFVATIQVLDRPAPDDAPRDGHPSRLGDFAVLRWMTRGGMGDIYEAVQEPLGRRVVVKTIRAGRHRLSHVARARFLREQMTLARLHHTHIVPIHAAGSGGDLDFFAMPYIDGAPLHQVVRAVRQLDPSRNGNSTPSLSDLVDSTVAYQGEDPAPEATPAGSTEEEPAGRPEAGPGLTLSARYLRSVARVMADAADALHHAHHAGVIHRDLKPSNLMVDRDEHCWLIDFGLAAQRPPLDVLAAAGPATEPVPEPPLASGVLGTLPYMAPEQFRSRADVRTDVWGLGATLYELLTLRRPFDGRDRDRAGPAPPRDLVRNLPRDLEAICLKALRADPAQRYQTARELGDDLRRWLRHEPVKARPARALRRVRMWARRNQGWAAAAAFAALALVGLATAGFVVAKAQAARAQVDRQQSIVQQVLRYQLAANRDGWSQTVWSLIRESAGLWPAGDKGLQAHAAGALAGLDARRSKTIPFTAECLAFDPEGRRLYLFGREDMPLEEYLRTYKDPSTLRVRAWERETDRLETLAIHGNGPFAFRPDGAPLQLREAADDPGFLQVWDLRHSKKAASLELPGEGTSRVDAFDITPSGSHVAACVSLSETESVYSSWDVGTGRFLGSFAAKEPTDLAIAPDGSLMAAATGPGEVTAWSLPGGERVATLHSGTTAIHGISFGRDPRAVEDGKSPRSWLLAAGDDGGIVTIWSLRDGRVRSFCHGSHYAVFTVAFSPDGKLLASGGRYHAKLWDVATGRLVLDVGLRDWMAALAFTPDGEHLAVATRSVFDRHANVDVWDLEDGRGIRNLRGLRGQVERTIFSPDGRLVAGVAQDWQVGIWERATGRLRRVLDVPQGITVDNCGMAFSPDGRRFAFAAGREAKLWDVDTGAVVDRWPVPWGLQDSLAYAAPDRLLLERMETRDGKVPPTAGFSPSEHPRVIRVRNLASDRPLAPIAEIGLFRSGPYGSAISPDGSVVVADGETEPNGGGRLVMGFDPQGGKTLWTYKTTRVFESAVLRFDPGGQVILGIIDEGPGAWGVLSAKTAALVGRVGDGPNCIGPGGRLWLKFDDAGPGSLPGCSVMEMNRAEPLLRIHMNELKSSDLSSFAPDGLALAWGNADGTLTLCDLPTIQRRLADVGLGW